jgi:septal ring-binding cell division protein DamX
VQAALRDSEFSQPPRRTRATPRPYAWAAAALVAGIAVGIGLYALVETSLARNRAPATSVQAAAPAPATDAPPIAAPAAPSTPAQAAAAPAAAAPVTPPSATPALAGATPPAATPTPAPSAAPADQPVTVAERAEAPAPIAEAGHAGGNTDIIATRMEATQRLLKSGATKPFSIQLLTAWNDEQLRNHLKALTKFVEVNDVYMYRSSAQGRPAVSVLWGNFSDRQSALEQLEDLPRPLRVNRPYVRSMDEVRADAGRNVSR